MSGRNASVAAAAAVATAGALAYAVRGRSAQIFGPSVYGGPRTRREIALTFDDGPSESTPAVLDLLARYGARATFFQCGVNVRRLPAIAREVLAQGHEIGNHSDTHAALYLRSADFILQEFARAQESIKNVTGYAPTYLRAPYGARWFGFSPMQKSLGLQGVMWTTIALDWKLRANQITARVLRSVGPGAILCFHDGRELIPRPDVRSTLDAIRRLIPELLDRGYRFRTVRELLAEGS